MRKVPIYLITVVLCAIRHVFQWFPVDCQLITIITSVTCSYLSGRLEWVDLLHHPLQHTGILQHNQPMSTTTVCYTVKCSSQSESHWLDSSKRRVNGWVPATRSEWHVKGAGSKWQRNDRTDVLYWCKSGKLPKFNQWQCLKKVFESHIHESIKHVHSFTTHQTSILHVFYCSCSGPRKKKTLYYHSAIHLF